MSFAGAAALGSMRLSASRGLLRAFIVCGVIVVRSRRRQSVTSVVACSQTPACSQMVQFEVLAVGDFEMLSRPCVDCGLQTGLLLRLVSCGGSTAQ